jgi:hypothetical protein
VKEKFTAKCGEAPDLSWRRLLSHTRRRSRTEKIESPVVIKQFLLLIGQSSIFNLVAIFEIAAGRTKRVRTPHGGFQNRPRAEYPRQAALAPSFRDAPPGPRKARPMTGSARGAESMLTMVVMDSGQAPSGASRNDRVGLLRR